MFNINAPLTQQTTIEIASLVEDPKTGKQVRGEGKQVTVYYPSLLDLLPEDVEILPEVAEYLQDIIIADAKAVARNKNKGGLPIPATFADLTAKADAGAALKAFREFIDAFRSALTKHPVIGNNSRAIDTVVSLASNKQGIANLSDARREALGKALAFFEQSSDYLVHAKQVDNIKSLLSAESDEDMLAGL